MNRARRIVRYLVGGTLCLTGAMLAGLAMHYHQAVPTWFGVMLVIIGAVVIDEADA